MPRFSSGPSTPRSTPPAPTPKSTSSASPVPTAPAPHCPKPNTAPPNNDEGSHLFPQLRQCQLQTRYHASNLFWFFFGQRGLRQEMQRRVIRLPCIRSIPVNFIFRLRL